MSFAVLGRAGTDGEPARNRRDTRVSLYGFIGSGNLGNDASFDTVLAWLRERGGIEPHCITIAPVAVRARYGVGATALNAKGPFHGAGGPLATAGKGLGRLLDLPRSLWLARRTDAVVVPGMGVLEESLGVRPWGLPMWLFLLALACRLARRPFVLLGVGAEPVRNTLTRALFVATVRLARHVSYRDEWSASSMRQAGALEPDAVAADLVFARPPSTRRAEPGRVVVGVMAYFGDSDDPWRGAADHEAYLATMVDVVVSLLDEGDRVVLLGGDTVDAAVAERIRSRAEAARSGASGQAVSVADPQTFGELTEAMAAAEVAVVSRFHNLICALALGVPVVSAGYAAKSERLMTSLGLAGYSQPIDQLDTSTLLTQIRRARSTAWPAELLAEQVAAQRERACRLLDAALPAALGLPIRNQSREASQR